MKKRLSRPSRRGQAKTEPKHKKEGCRAEARQPSHDTLVMAQIFSKTGVYSMGAATVTRLPPSKTSPVEVSFH